MVTRERSLPRLTAELAEECETWRGQFVKALSSIEALCAATESSSSSAAASAGGVAGATPGAALTNPTRGGRRHTELLSMLRLVGDRLGAASTQVQHTRGQAAALTQLHEKLVASEKEQERLRRVADAATAAEARAACELEALRSAAPSTAVRLAAGDIVCAEVLRPTIEC